MSKIPTPAEIAEIEKQIPMDYEIIESNIKFIQGKVLTIIEASIHSDSQCKAVKDLIKHVFSESLTKIYNETHPNQEMLSEADMEREWGSVDAFYEANNEIIEEALQEGYLK